MNDAKTFRKKAFGGFNQDDVVAYVTKLANERNEALTAISEKNEEIGVLKQQLQGRIALGATPDAIPEISEVYDLLAGLKTDLETKEAQLEDMQRRYVSREKVIEEMRQQSMLKDDEILNLKSQLDENKDGNGGVGEQDESIAELNRLVGELKESQPQVSPEPLQNPSVQHEVAHVAQSVTPEVSQQQVEVQAEPQQVTAEAPQQSAPHPQQEAPIPPQQPAQVQAEKVEIPQQNANMQPDPLYKTPRSPQLFTRVQAKPQQKTPEAVENKPKRIKISVPRR